MPTHQRGGFGSSFDDSGSGECLDFGDLHTPLGPSELASRPSQALCRAAVAHRVEAYDESDELRARFGLERGA